MQRERDLNLQLQDEKYHALTKLDQLREQWESLNKECEQVLMEMDSMKVKEREQQRQAEAEAREKQMLERKTEDLMQIMKEAESHMRMLEKQIDTQKVEIEKAKVVRHKAKEIKH